MENQNKTKIKGFILSEDTINKLFILAKENRNNKSLTIEKLVEQAFNEKITSDENKIK